MSKYLYGAAVQGIQQYIFRTNKLKDIVAASDKVKAICDKYFKDLIEEEGLEMDDKHCIIHAAGNIKYIFDEDKEAQCRAVVQKFPRKVLESVPGITISQAVVAFDDSDNDHFVDSVNELERRLRVQRNRQLDSMTIGLMGIKRDQATNLPIMTSEKVDMTEVNYELCKQAFDFDDEEMMRCNVSYKIEDMTDENDWIAVVHVDGNGLGQVVQSVGKVREDYQEFSTKLDEATKKAAQVAFKKIRNTFNLGNNIPIRPTVLGGDDFSFICRADLALDYVNFYLEEFENQTHKLNGELLTKANNRKGVFSKGKIRDRLTACAGIAYIKSSFPYYYAYNLAESLCDAAKKNAKNEPYIKEGYKLPGSCVMFHKVQDSFITNYKDIVKRELTPNDCVSFQAGPYYRDEDFASERGKWTIKDLSAAVNLILAKKKEGNAMKSDLRQWMSLLFYDKQMARQKLRRLKTILTDEELRGLLDKLTDHINYEIGNSTTQVYDILTIHTIKTQKTKDE